MSNEPPSMRYLRILAPAVSPGASLPPDAERSARFRCLMNAPPEVPTPESSVGHEVSGEVLEEPETKAGAGTTDITSWELQSVLNGRETGPSDERQVTATPSRADGPASERASTSRPGAIRTPTWPVRRDHRAIPTLACSSTRHESLRSYMPHGPNDSRFDAFADHISRLVTLKNASRDEWAVTLKLDPAIVNETALHLTISRLYLSLRFESPLLASRALICANADGLATRLEACINRRTSIVVTG